MTMPVKLPPIITSVSIQCDGKKNTWKGSAYTEFRSFLLTIEGYMSEEIRNEVKMRIVVWTPANLLR
jgi:hypothetical protein